MLHWPFTKFGLVTVCSVSWQFYYTYEYSKYCLEEKAVLHYFDLIVKVFEGNSEIT